MIETGLTPRHFLRSWRKCVSRRTAYPEPRLVMDPFMGLGSTAVACLGLGVSCIGYEIDGDYFRSCYENLVKDARARGLVP